MFSIRLLHLLPATDYDAKLKCQLIETRIPDYSYIRGQSQISRGEGLAHVQYQALSYTWGEPKFPKSLYVLTGPGGDSEVHTSLAGVIKITENLYSALQNLRKPDKPLVLWVDAVCINQANIAERNSQVSNIPQTYAAASNVLVWLGVDDLQHSGQLCFGFFSDLAALIVEDSNGRRQDDRASWRKRFNINKMVSAFLDRAHPQPIAFFLDRPWFRRRWIVQEVVLANDIFVYFGEASIHWNTLQLALTELLENHKGAFSEEHCTTLRTMSCIRNADCGPKSQVPLDTLIEFESYLCANPRDRLYALYGVIQRWFPGSTLKKAPVYDIDYALSIDDVFTNFAILMIRLTGMLRPDTTYDPVTHVLQLAAAIKQPMFPGERPVSELHIRIPSWVPNWTSTLTNTPLNHSPTDRDASSGIPKCQVEIPSSNYNRHLLISIGLVYDIVTAYIPIDINPLFGLVYEAKATLNNFLYSVAESLDDTGFFNAADIDVYRPTGQHIISAIATALVANWELTPPNSFFAQHHRFPGDFLEQLSSSKHHLPEILHKWPAYVELVAITMRGRGLFLTLSGYIGIALPMSRLATPSAFLVACEYHSFSDQKGQWLSPCRVVSLIFLAAILFITKTSSRKSCRQWRMSRQSIARSK